MAPVEQPEAVTRALLAWLGLEPAMQPPAAS
jgi:hypothetical protein